MMRVLVTTLLACGLGASIAFATGTTAGIDEQVLDTLTAIDTVPTKDQLDDAFETDTLSGLSTLARDKLIDIGVRLRAIHALAKYCPDPCSQNDVALTSLTTLIDQGRNETLGEPLVLLRASIETFGTLQIAAADMAPLVNPLLFPLLDHPSRDIRAATARALRDLCNTQAVIPLRVRYTNEPTDQVKLAISDALRILGQCGL